MTKRKKNPAVKAISMTDYSRAIHECRDFKEKRAARKNASPITVYKPDADGSMVALEEVAVPKLEVSRNRNMRRIWSTV